MTSTSAAPATTAETSAVSGAGTQVAVPKAPPPTRRRELIKRHPVVIYFALTFAISWGGMLLLIYGRRGATSANEQTDPLVYLAMLAGPTIAGILLTSVVYGRAGLRELLAGVLRWRVSLGWYAVALLTAPLLAATTLGALLPASSAYLPAILGSDDKLALLLAGVAVGLAAGIFEEIGWTGFAIPQLRLRHGVLVTGVIVGCLWGAWHLLLFFWTSGGFSGALSPGLFLPAILFCEAVAPAFRVLMVWVYDRTASVFIAMLMHGSLSGGVAIMLIPTTIVGVPLGMWYILFAAALWVAVAIVAVANHGQLGRRSLGAPAM